MSRPTFDTYYLNIAQAVAARGECVRRTVGAIIVNRHHIVATGYNGAPPGEPSCLDAACPRAFKTVSSGQDYAESGCHVLHAETNAMLRASWDQMDGATLYVTHPPCQDCWPKIMATGIARVVYPGSESTYVEWVRP